MANDTTVPNGYGDLNRQPIVRQANGDIKPPKNIIKSPQAARTLYLKVRQEHLKRVVLYSSIEGLISGNPPYDPDELLQHGLSHIANFNTLDARSLYERGSLAYWNLNNQAETLVKFIIMGKDPILNEFADIMSKHFSDVVREWRSFETYSNMLQGQLVKFGLSPVLWPDERDWRWRVIDLSKFYVQDQASSDIEMLTYVALESKYPAQWLMEIYNYYKNEHPEEKSPWNLDELSFLLLKLANTYVKPNSGGLAFPDMMTLQQRWQNGDLMLDPVFTDDIQLITLLYKEYDGKISNYMFHPMIDNGELLYFADRQYDTMQEALLIFTASPGEFTLHSNRGLGHKIFSMAQAMNQLDCSILDMARLSSTPLLKGLATGSKEFEQIRFIPGVPTNIGLAEFQDNKLGSNINQLIEASQYMLGKIQFNTANSGDDPGVPDRDTGSKSPAEVRMQSYREFGVLKNSMAHYYKFWDLVVENMAIKMFHSKETFPGYDAAKEFKRRCMQDGVPEEIFKMATKTKNKLPVNIKIKATRVAGDGSTLARIIGLQELQDIVPEFGPREMKAYKKQRIMAALGNDYVKEFLQDSDDADEQSGGASLAGAENNNMEMGFSPIFSRDNEHRSHMVTHMALGMDIINRIQQQQLDAIGADKIFNSLIPHMAQHWQVIEQSPLQISFVEKVKKSWDQLQDYAKLNRNNATKMYQAQIKKQQEQAAKTQEVLSDEELKNVKAAGDERRADYKVQSQVQRASEANVTRGQVMRDKVRSDADVKRLELDMQANQNPAEGQSLQENRVDLSTINGATISPNDIETV